MIVSITKKKRQNRQTSFFNPNGKREDKPLQCSFFLSIFTLVVFVLMTNPWHLLVYADVIRHLYDGKRKRGREREIEERENKNRCVFLFLLSATGVPSILRCLFQISSHASIMNATRTGRFIFLMLSFSLSSISLFLSYFLLFSILWKEKNDSESFFINHYSTSVSLFQIHSLFYKI